MLIYFEVGIADVINVIVRVCVGHMCDRTCVFVSCVCTCVYVYVCVCVCACVSVLCVYT